MNVKVFRSLSLLLVLLAVFSCTNINVFAAETKTLTKTQIRQYAGTPQQAQNMLNKFVEDARKYNWNYNDVNCQGTLYFTGQYKLLRQRELGSGSFLYDWEFTYSGTVTLKQSKEATSKVVYKNAGTSSNYMNFLRTIKSSTINYDDGEFKGTLYYNSNYVITYKQVSQFGPIYYWEVEVTYKGTVYRK